MISGLLSAELSATCNALGYSSGSTYYTDPYVKETITDLIRYLRRDDEDHTIRRHLGCAKVLQTDLLPILIYHSENEDLFDVLLRLLVNLTNPALLIYQEQLPTERTASHHFLQLVAQLQSYKEAFTDQQLWEILAKKLADLLQIAYHERDEDQSRTMERILILARNVLQVPTDADENRPDNDASIHDQVLWALNQGGMVDLFLYIASTDHEQQYYMHILEIVSLMLREQNPATLSSSALQRSQQEKERDEKELLEIRQREIKEKQAKVKFYTGSRHSRFGGTFVIKDHKSISDRDQIFHKPPSKVANFSVDTEKERSKVPKNKQALVDRTSERRSAFSVRLFLKEFCVEFLNGAYNPLMYKVRENLVRAVGQPNDETYYFWAMKFFMEFNRLYKFQVKLVSETMHKQIFHFVQTQMETWLESMIVDKKKIPVWSKRIHQALKAYQELLLTLQAMDRSPEQSVRESSRVIKSNIFYESEYRELIVYLFNVFTETKFSRAYLKDLVETAHIFLKMLEQFCSRHQNLIVQGKAKKKTQKKKKKGAPKKSVASQNLESIWDQVGPELSAVLQGQAEIPSDVSPIDAVSDLTMEQQKREAMKKIQLELKQGNFEQAVGLLRASREVWPENDSFGHANMAPDEEFLAIREIFMIDIGQPAEAAVEENNAEESEDDEEDPRAIEVPEQTFKFFDFVARQVLLGFFAHIALRWGLNTKFANDGTRIPSVLRQKEFASHRMLSPVCLLLEQFETNSHHTNHCALKILHRVAWDLKMPTLLFQASLFRTFQRAFRSDVPEHKELKKFAVFIMRKFTETAKKNKKIFMEILFWKSKKEAEELEVGYGNLDDKSHSSKNVWREEQEDELRRLAAEYERDIPEPDAVAWIMKNMIDQTRSRRAVVKKMKELYLTVGNIKPKRLKEFSEEDIAELRTLFEQYKNAENPIVCILGRLSAQRSRKAVVDKMLELGIIASKNEVYKKTKKKGETKRKGEKSGTEKQWGQRSDDESIYDSWSDDDENVTSNSCSGGQARKLARVGQPSLAQMCCNLRRVVDADMQEALEWLKTSLQEAVDDLDDDGDDEEGIALLPLTALCIQAMENPTFLQLLDIMSIEKPTDQEMYWRIPGRWRAEDLNKRIDLIRDALAGILPDVGPEVELMPTASQESPAKKKKRFTKKKPKKSFKEALREEDNGSTRSSLHDSSSESDNETITPKRILSKSSSDEVSSRRNSGDSQSENESLKSRKFDKHDDSESMSDKENTGVNTTSTGVQSKAKIFNNRNLKKQGKKFNINSDTEDDEMIVTSTQKSETHRENITSGKLIDSSDSETNSSKTNTTKTSTTLADNSETKKNKFNNVKRKKLVESDSEDGNVNSSRTSVNSPSQSSIKRINKRKRLNIESDSSDDGNSTLNSTKTSVATVSKRSTKSDSESAVKKKRLSLDSDSDDGNSTLNSTKMSVATPSQRSIKSHNEGSVKGKRRSSDSDSDDGNSTLNSTKTSVATPSQRSTRSDNESAVKGKQHSSDSDSDDRNSTLNSTKTSVATQSQRSTRSDNESAVKGKRRSSDSDSDDRNSTLNSTKTSVATPSQRSTRSDNESAVKGKRHSSDSGSDDGNSTLNSTKTSVATPSHRSTRSDNESALKKKRLSLDSDSDDKNSTLNSTKTSVATTSQKSTKSQKERPAKKKRLSIDSDSDERPNETKDFSITREIKGNEVAIKSNVDGKLNNSDHEEMNVGSESGSINLGSVSAFSNGNPAKRKRLKIYSDSD